MQDEARTGVRRSFLSGAFFCALAITVVASVSIAAEGQVVATVGNHKITEKELDAKDKAAARHYREPAL